MREPAAHAARGGVLVAAALRDFADTISGALRARAALDDQEAPLLRELAAAIEPALAPLATRSTAPSSRTAPSCATTPRRAAQAPRRAPDRPAARAEKLEQLVRKPRPPRAPPGGLRHAARGTAGARREGELAEQRAGIVHDASDSGQTLFVEPFEVVELNNRQSEAAGAEREEVERILRELSAAAGEQADALTPAVEATGRIDLTLARGTVSRGWRGAPVEVLDEVRLIGARHPLLDPPPRSRSTSTSAACARS